MTRQTTDYPTATRLDLVEDLHGHRVADPYRWLEDADDPRTAEWSRRQDEFATARLAELPGRQRLAESLTDLLAAGSVSAPVWRAGRAFFTRRLPGQEHAALVVTEPTVTGERRERVLLDVSASDPTGLTTLDAWSPSLEGELLAYQVSTGGDEESTLRVLDVRTGAVVDGPIDRCKYSDIAWLPGGTEFCYVRRLPAEAVPAGEDAFHRRVWRHRVGTAPEQDELLHGEGLDKTYYYGVTVSPDGRWLVVDGSIGTARRESVWLAELHPSRPVDLRPVVTDADDCRCSAWVGRDGRLYLLTTKDAPRWRLCVADPRRPEPAGWTELVAEDPDSVLDAVRWLDATDRHPAQLVLARSRHAVAELHLHDAETGERTAEIPLPGAGSLTSLSTVDERTEPGRDRVWFGWTDFLTPAGVHVFDRGTGATTLLTPAPGTPTLPAARTEQVEYRSADGTPVRMFVVSPAAGPAGPRPTLLTGYGGFSVSYEQTYSAAALAWVAAGGVWVLASLRGGAEEGEAWHEAGMRAYKQNTFDDFHAAAEALVEQGRTTPEQLAVLGGSNGGLLVGAALTQRPELYRAVVCSAPLLDMVRYERFLIGRIWHEEYGSADDPTELGWLLGYSPYHRVRAGVSYPSVLFTVFDSDSRVDPCHARKMCAAVQHATAATPGERPVLLRRETEVGHAARSVSRTVGLLVDELAFLAHATGLALQG